MFILVLGGTGFIGSHLVDELTAHHHRIRVFSRKARQTPNSPPGVEYYAGDFANPFAVAEAMQDIDAVAHLVSTTLPATSNLDPIADIQSNLTNSVHLLQTMQATGVKKILYVSSGGTIYGPGGNLPIDENTPLQPICSYGIVKAAIENYLRMFQRLYDLSPVILRVANPYGPRQGHLGTQGVIATFVDRIRKQEAINIWGDGSAVRDYVYVTDVARACRLALETETCSCVNIASGTGHSLNDIIRQIEMTLAKTAQVHYSDARKFDVDKIILDITKAREVLGWEPEITLPVGLQQYWQWLRSQDGY